MLRKNKYHWATNSTSNSSHLQVKTRQAGFGLACNQSPFLIPSYQDPTSTIGGISISQSTGVLRGDEAAKLTHQAF